MKKRTTEDFIKIIGDDYTLLSEFNGNNTKVTLKHEVCGKNWLAWPGNVIKGIRCPFCSNQKKKTPLEFAKLVYDITEGEYESLGDYTTVANITTLLHVTCGTIYEVSANKFLSGRRHNACRGHKTGPRRVRKTTTTFNAEIISLPYRLESEYTFCNEPAIFRHLKCGKTFTRTPTKVLSQLWGCPHCTTRGFNKSKPAILYSFEINNLCKIGITTRQFTDRYNKTDRSNIINLRTLNIATGEAALVLEGKLKQLCKEHRYFGPSPFTDSTGVTELFTKNQKLMEVLDVTFE